MKMKSQFNYFEAAQITGSKRTLADFLKSIPSVDYDTWTIVKKSDRIWAAFSGEGVFIIPSSEPTYTIKEFLEL